jgi:RHS repeat-associated protein
LGNVRLSYGRDPQAHNEIKILEENHYYPYGLKHTNYNANLNAYKKDNNDQVQLTGTGLSADLINKYKFNGMEYQDELGLNLYDMDMRDYDPAIGRWTGIDPVTHFDQSPYMGMNGNPVFWADPSGADGVGGWTSSQSFGTTYETPNSSDMNTGYNIGSAFGAFAENVGSAWGDGGLLSTTYYGAEAKNIFSYYALANGYTKYTWTYYDTEYKQTGVGIGRYKTSYRGSEFDSKRAERIASGIGVNMGIKEGLIQLAKESGDIGTAGAKYLSYAQIIGKATGVVGAGTAWYDYYNKPTTGGLVKAFTGTGLVFVRVNPFIGVGIGILDLTGGSDWFYNQVGTSIDDINK